MKHVPNILGALLGLLFVVGGATFLLGMVPEQEPPPEGSTMALFWGAFGPSGYMTFVKVCELVGGLAVLVPKTRGLGVLILGPIVVNIFAFHVFVAEGAMLGDPMLIATGVLTLAVIAVEAPGLVRFAFKTGG